MKSCVRAIQLAASLARMGIVDKMWAWGFAAGIFLMAAINALASAINGGGGSAWVQMLASIVVVLVAIVISLNLRKAESLNRAQVQEGTPLSD